MRKTWYNGRKEVMQVKHRIRLKAKKDKKVFKKTASKSKKINITPKLMRGGIRL